MASFHLPLRSYEMLWLVMCCLWTTSTGQVCHNVSKKGKLICPSPYKEATGARSWWSRLFQAFRSWGQGEQMYFSRSLFSHRPPLSGCLEQATVGLTDYILRGNWVTRLQNHIISYHIEFEKQLLSSIRLYDWPIAQIS